MLLEDKEGKSGIIIDVEKSVHPVSFQSKYYTRSGSTTQELRGMELQKMILKANNLTWDEVIDDRASFDDIDERIVRLFVNRAIEYNRLPTDIDFNDTRKLFHNLELTDKNGNLTRAAILIFGKQPTRFIKSATFKIGRFRGEDYTDLVIQDLVEGNIFQMADRVLDLLKAKYLTSPISYKGIQRIEMLEIPEKALREAILNAIIHRDYASTTAITLRIFDKSVVLWNLGELPPQLTIKQLLVSHGSYPRNPLIAKMFFRAGFIEAWGRGTITIISETVNGGLSSPKFNLEGNGIVVTFPRIEKQEVEQFQVIKDNCINARQQKAIEYVQMHGSINNSEYRKLNEVSGVTAKRDLKQLVEFSIFDKEGIGKLQIYFLK